MSSTKKLLVVFGATGNQGGSVINSILSDTTAKQQFAIRAITRDTTKPSATALAEKGVEVFKADLEDKESLRAALKDAYAVFAVTNFQENYDAKSETRQGKNVVDVAKERNVQHLVWSSLPHVSKITNNKITNVVHFDSKGLVDDYIRDIGVPSTMLHLGIFNHFIVSSLAAMPTNPSSYKLCFPHPAKANSLIPLIDVVADTGKYVKAILLNPDKAIGKTINAAENFYTMDEVVGTFKTVGIDVAFEAVDEGVFRGAMTAKGLPEFFQDDTLDNVKFISTYGYFGGGTLEEGHQLLTEPLNSFEHFLKNGDALAALKG